MQEYINDVLPSDHDKSQDQTSGQEMSRQVANSNNVSQHSEPVNQAQSSLHDSSTLDHDNIVATGRVLSGQSTYDRDLAGHVAKGLDPSRPDGSSLMAENHHIEGAKTLDDCSKPSSKPKDDTDDTPRPFADWVDIETTSEILRDEGIVRTIRTIQRMCKRGDLVARLVPTENGVRYLIERGSIYEFVERHNQMMPSGKLTAGSEVVEEKRSNGSQPISQTESSGNSQQVAEEKQVHLQEILSMKKDQIDFLKGQLDLANEQLRVKDEQISTMLERDHETNILIQNLQQLMALPAAKDGFGKSNANNQDATLHS